MKQTLKQAGYIYMMHDRGEHYLGNVATGEVEVFTANKNFAGWGLKYKNTHLEFVRSL